jgi:hypothetical protein
MPCFNGGAEDDLPEQVSAPERCQVERKRPTLEK